MKRNFGTTGRCLVSVLVVLLALIMPTQALAHSGTTSLTIDDRWYLPYRTYTLRLSLEDTKTLVKALDLASIGGGGYSAAASLLAKWGLASLAGGPELAALAISLRADSWLITNVCSQGLQHGIVFTVVLLKDSGAFGGTPVYGSCKSQG